MRLVGATKKTHKIDNAPGMEVSAYEKGDWQRSSGHGRGLAAVWYGSLVRQQPGFSRTREDPTDLPRLNSRHSEGCFLVVTRFVSES